jgi:Protein of unknown function (DUF1565)
LNKLLPVIPIALLITTCTSTPYAATTPIAADYYIDTQGSDTGNGSKTAPWKSLSKALAAVPKGTPKTIAFSPGTFTVGVIDIPTGITLIGSGSQSTTLKGGLRLRGNNINIRNLKLDGDRQAYNTGLLIRDSDRLQVKNLLITGHKWQAINIERVSNSEISHSTFTDTSFNNYKPGGGGKQSSAMSVGNLTNVTFHHLTIDTRARGGAGINSSDENWNEKEPWSSPHSILRNVKFHNLDIKVDKFHSWGNGNTPQLALELWHQTCHNCEIFNSTFNSTVSLVTHNSTRIRVYNNRWEGPDNPFYACEADSDNLEFDHNHIRGGSYPIALFNKSDRNNIVVHHNIFENTSAPTLVGHFLNRVNGFKFYNNTVYVNSKVRLFYYEKGEASNQEIRNNIFYNTQEKVDKTMTATVGVRDNLFFNNAPVGTSAMTLDPQLRRSGQQPNEYFAPRNLKATKYGAVYAGSKRIGP